MGTKDIWELSYLIQGASLIILQIGDKKVGLGHDMQEMIVSALIHYAESIEREES